MVSSRQTADERRTSVLAAAITEFARSGYAGTSTEAIARRAGISQPYLFRLFGTKKDLFLATNELVSNRIIHTLTAACADLQGEAAMVAMGSAYLDLLTDPELLQVQMHGFAAATGDADIARSCRRTFEALWNVLDERANLPEESVQQFFATGMMINVMSAIDLLSVSDRWAQSLCPNPEKAHALIEATRVLNERRQQQSEDSNDTQQEVAG